jgi:hypothetical protein
LLKTDFSFDDVKFQTDAIGNYVHTQQHKSVGWNLIFFVTYYERLYEIMSFQDKKVQWA